MYVYRLEGTPILHFPEDGVRYAFRDKSWMRQRWLWSRWRDEQEINALTNELRDENDPHVIAKQLLRRP